MEIELKKDYLPLILIFVVGIIYIYFASTTQMLGEDEATYFDLAKSFMNGEFPMFKPSGYNANVPPLMPLIYIPFFIVFGASLSVAKVVTAIFGVLTLLMMYLIGKKFGWVAALASVALLLSIPLFTHFMMISYVEVPIAFFAALALYLFMKPMTMKNSVLLGVVLALSFYVKYSGFFLVVGYFLYYVTRYIFKRDVNLKPVLITCLIFTLLISPWLIKNLIFYNYPYLEGFNLLFQKPAEYPQWLADALSTLSPTINYYDTFGFVALILGIFGAVYVLSVKEEKLYLPVFLTVLFILLFNIRSLTGLEVGESRYFAVVFPYAALVGSYFLEGLYKKNKMLLPIVALVIVLSLYMSFSVALSTNATQRYPQNYISALQWIDSNTPKDAKIFTAYEGSLKIFGERDNVWAMDEFPELMTTQDSTYIYDTLEKYNASYILIWRGIVAENYIIPESNLIGAFTYNFLNVVSNDTEHFNATYQNQDNIIFKLT
jgi:4-amino-4-deoxy-L-arabinose transferase-like glycosyltransferase